MNKKGFTLVELLAVIVILGVVISIATVSITAIKKKTDLAMLAEKADFISSAGITYFENDTTKDSSLKTPNDYLKNANNGCVVTGKFLISQGSLETGEVDSSGNPVITNTITNNDISGLTVYVYMKYNRIYSCIPTTNANKALLADLEDAEVDKSFYCQEAVSMAEGYATDDAISCS